VTTDERSLVCESGFIQDGAESEPGWRLFRVRGPFAFEITGVIATIAGPLARAGVSLFSVSTFETDYFLVKQVDLERAVKALRAAGHDVYTAEGDLNQVGLQPQK
jgi:hypothetical protein